MKIALALGSALLVPVLALAAPPQKSPELLGKGKTSFTTNCVLCHGEKGDGNGPAGAQMNPKPRDFSDVKSYKNGSKPEQIFKTLAEGIPGSAMVPFAHLSEEERWALAYYVADTFHKPAGKAKGKK
ncbi:MAG: cytochrome c [Myxococcota bacterium]